MTALPAPAARNARRGSLEYSGSHIAGAAALPANLNADTTEVAPARLAGTASTINVFSPAQTRVCPAPAPTQNAVRAAAVCAAPTRPTSSPHARSPQNVT